MCWILVHVFHACLCIIVLRIFYYNEDSGRPFLSISLIFRLEKLVNMESDSSIIQCFKIWNWYIIERSTFAISLISHFEATTSNNHTPYFGKGVCSCLVGFPYRVVSGQNKVKQRKNDIINEELVKPRHLSSIPLLSYYIFKFHVKKRWHVF